MDRKQHRFSIQKLPKLLPYFPAVLLLATMIGGFAVNRDTIANRFQTVKPEDFNTFSDGFEADLAENFQAPVRYSFLNLKNTLSRSLGIHTENQIFRFTNGMLYRHEGVDRQGLFTELRSAADFCSLENIPLIVVPVPTKECFSGASFAPGYNDGTGEIFRGLVDDLKAADICTIDMDLWWQENNWSMEDVYFRTDHHWLPTAALQAARVTMETLKVQGWADYDPASLDDQHYATDLRKQSFLGSEGRRTGTAYAGIDDFPFVHPADDKGIYTSRILTSGAYSTWTPYMHWNLTNTDLYATDLYGDVYMGGNYSRTVLHNFEPANKKTMLILGDSFMVPYNCFLSSQFEHIVHLDLRAYTDGTVAEAILSLKPDLVLIGFAANRPAEELAIQADTCVDHFQGKRAVNISVSETLSLTAKDNAHNGLSLANNLPAGSYKLSVKQITLTRSNSAPALGGADAAIRDLEAAVIDTRTGDVITRWFFTKDATDQSWCFTLPQNQDVNQSLIVYAGTNGKTSFYEAELSGICLERFE